MNNPPVTPRHRVKRNGKPDRANSHFRLSLIKLAAMAELCNAGKLTSDSPIVLAIARQLAVSDSPSLLAASLAVWHRWRQSGKLVASDAASDATNDSGGLSLAPDVLDLVAVPIRHRRAG